MNGRYSRWTLPLATLCAAAAITSCAHTLERTLTSPEKIHTLDGTSPYLKVHLRSGGVYVLDQWHVDSMTRAIVGHGKLLDARRQLVNDGDYRLPNDSAALFETNLVKPSGGSTALTVMAGITAAVTGYCAVNPKACFGSCPTFYVTDASGKSVLAAEGFSASVAPALEATDLDALWQAKPRGRDFDIVMANEALETHALRYVDVIAVPRPPGTRVIALPDDRFVAASDFRPATRCDAAEGDCRFAVASFDGVMRSSNADSVDLATKETIDLEFARPESANLGVVIGSRQTLMTTFLFYQGLAYLGNAAAPWMATMQAGTPDSPNATERMAALLGRIDVLVPDDRGNWTVAGTIGESGPLATDIKIVPIPHRGSNAGPVRVRLRMTKGLWRLDWVALATVSAAGAPIRIAPSSAEHDRRDDPAALAALRGSGERLATMPGDRYRLRYHLPADPSGLELFVESRGYYLEWMRREWIAEEDAGKAARFFLDPAGTLRQLAKPFTRQEAGMDSLFWGSRYARH